MDQHKILYVLEELSNVFKDRYLNLCVGVVDQLTDTISELQHLEVLVLELVDVGSDQLEEGV